MLLRMPHVRNVTRVLLPRGLAGYMALATSVLCVILTLILVSLVQSEARTHAGESIGQGLGELAQQAADKLDRGLYERYREIGLLARHLADLGPNAPRDAQRRLLDDAYRSDGDYSWLGIAAVDGRVTVAAGGVLEGVDVGSRPWFSSALVGTHVSDVQSAQMGRIRPPAEGEPQGFVDLAFPIDGPGGRRLGVLGARSEERRVGKECPV